MDYQSMLIGITEIAVALAGFTGVVVAFGSRRNEHWHAGDRLRLGFLMEASLTAAGFSLLALIIYSALGNQKTVWAISSALWSVYMVWSLLRSRKKIRQNKQEHEDIDSVSNSIVSFVFISLIVLQIANVLWLESFTPLLIALTINLVGAAMQFSRLIVSAFDS